MVNDNVNMIRKGQCYRIWLPAGSYNIQGNPEALFSHRKVRTGIVVPGFAKLRREKKLIPDTNFSFLEENRYHPQGWCWIEDRDPSWYKYSNKYVGPMTSVVTCADAAISEFSAYEKAGVDARAINKVLLAMKSQKVNLLQVLAERQQTVKLLTETMTRFAAAVINLKRGNFVQAANQLGVKTGWRARSRFNRSYTKNQGSAVTSGWLQLQYGWKPLLQDCYGAAELLQARHEMLGFETLSCWNTLNRDEGRRYSLSPFTVRRTGRSFYKVKYLVRYSADNSVVHSLSSMGFTNPALIAWELLPFSFVVDWFLPIGNWISSLDATVGLKFHSGVKIVVDSHSVCEKTYANAVYQGTQRFTADMSASVKRFSVTRTVLKSFPSPKIPSFKNPVSLTHFANAMSLLTQLFKR